MDIADVKADYSRQDLVEGFRKVGIAFGDVVYTVVGLAQLGKAANCSSSEQLCGCLLSALQEVTGSSGTIIIPTYTFSFCRGEIFDVQNTPAIKGPWSPSTDFLEFFRKQPGALRSRDPIHSVAALGPKAPELLSDLPPTCFGEDSIPHRMRRMGGKICAIGLGLHESNFQHHVEEMHGVPFRFKKVFAGQIRDNGATEKKSWIYNVGILAKNGRVDEHRLEKSARDAGICRTARVGCGEILGIDCQELFEFTSQALTRDPWFTAQGPAADPIDLERSRVGGSRYEANLPTNASMIEMIDAIRKLPRHIVSEGYDASLAALATQVPMKILQYPTGTECGNWIIPEKWTCHEAYLETLGGWRLFSYSDNPLHVASYSLPFEGEVSRKDLFEHLYVLENIPEMVPLIFRYYERDWGLCCSKKLKDTLLDNRYKVVIKTDFSFGTLKVGEVVAPGKTDKNIMLCANLCNEPLVNDDLCGVVVGIKVMQNLLSRNNLRHSYRFLIVPEAIGSAAYLSHNAQYISKMSRRLSFDREEHSMPYNPHRSSTKNSEPDVCFATAKRHDSIGWRGDHRTDLGNHASPLNVLSILSLSRGLLPAVPYGFCGEFDPNFDPLDTISNQNLESSYDLVLSVIEKFENSRILGDPCT